PHLPGKRPYLYDFIGDGTGNWQYGIVDSLATEAPGTNNLMPGFAENPWDVSNGSKLACDARLQLSRTPDGSHVIFTWSESDTSVTYMGTQWNTLPNIKARALETTNYTLSDTRLDLTDMDPHVSYRAFHHFVSPRSSSATVASGTITIKLPATIT